MSSLIRLVTTERLIAHCHAQDADAAIALMSDDAKSVPANPVTLNLFQGPSGRKLGASKWGTNPTVWLANARSGRGVRWTLKQVQGDGGSNELVSGALRG